MSFYDEIEIEDMTYHESTTLYTYPCPCGDQFEISLADLRDGEEVAVCPSCSLMIKVIFDAVSQPTKELLSLPKSNFLSRRICPRETEIHHRRQRMLRLQLKKRDITMDQGNKLCNLVKEMS